MRSIHYIAFAFLLVMLNQVEATPRIDIEQKERVFILKRPNGTLYIKRVPPGATLPKGVLK
jgi:hypothetical protein